MGHATRQCIRYVRASAREYDAIVNLVRAGWGRDNPAFRQVFTSRFGVWTRAQAIVFARDRGFGGAPRS